MPYIHSQQKPEIGLLSGGLIQASMFWGANVGKACSLTGLPGLTSFYDIGTPLVDRCLAEGIPCAVALVDIDHFHRVTVLHCQEVADKVLQAIAVHLRAMDGGHIVARLSEEEFGLLLIGLDDEAAALLCEDLRQAIASTAIVADEAKLSVTVSIGVAEVHGPETFDNYLNAAEQFLFMAKNNGRNQVFSDHLIAAMV
ncbi:GGDEF domain-containing protein [Neorhizobium lilium]|uniref:diguanylate cyclase n=1 Tax=Neorhizobium lilium TaxID=2503024 RepID=A0A444LH57_9HYPH|nr:GGDEF domain-containing protein [Neorhizobium lilium]RWX78390.1 GGDEF domain-containing protein [Neorhizobium lilium]